MLHEYRTCTTEHRAREYPKGGFSKSGEGLLLHSSHFQDENMRRMSLQRSEQTFALP